MFGTNILPRLESNPRTNIVWRRSLGRHYSSRPATANDTSTKGGMVQVAGTIRLPANPIGSNIHGSMTEQKKRQTRDTLEISRRKTGSIHGLLSGALFIRDRTQASLSNGTCIVTAISVVSEGKIEYKQTNLSSEDGHLICKCGIVAECCFQRFGFVTAVGWVLACNEKWLTVRVWLDDIGHYGGLTTKSGPGMV